MRLRALLALALLLGAAGCVGQPEAAPDAAEGAAVDASADAAPVFVPSDPGNMPHLHDYWQGRERVTLFDDEVAPVIDPFGTGFTLLVAKKARAGEAFWLLPDGEIVYEGTGELHLTATWDDPAISSLGVGYRSPESKDWAPRTQLASGEAFIVPVTPPMTDLPHAKTSRWAFHFSAQDHGVVLGAFHLKVEIVKLRDVTMFPAHPELFEGKPEKVLHDEEHSFSEESYAKRVPNLVTQGQFGEKEVAPTQLVPMETLWMRVEVDVTDATASPGQVADIRFFYRGADRSVIGHPYLLPVEGSLAEKRLVYAFPVEPVETDTPYGAESQWRFFVEPTTKFVGHEQEPDCGGCTDVSISYRLKVIAYDHVPEGAVESEKSG